MPSPLSRPQDPITCSWPHNMYHFLLLFCLYILQGLWHLKNIVLLGLNYRKKLLTLIESTFSYLTIWWFYKSSTLSSVSPVVCGCSTSQTCGHFLSCVRQSETHVCETQREVAAWLTALRSGTTPDRLSSVLLHFSEKGNLMIWLTCNPVS